MQTNSSDPFKLLLTTVAVACLLVTSMAISGCSNTPPAVKMPPLDPDAIASKALEEYDSDGNGELSKAELDGCPGIRDSIELYDTDGNNAVSGDEIKARAEKWIADKGALLSFVCSVTLKGRALVGATVKLVPEDFMGGAISPAEGVVEQTGSAIIAVAEEALDPAQQGRRIKAVNVGVYKVEITHPNPKVKVPAKYNTETTLGIEIAGDNLKAMQETHFKLK